MRSIFVILLAFITALITPKAFALNRVLFLNGDGDYVEIEDSESLNAINSQVTMEAWIHPTAFTNQWMPIIYKGDKRTPDFKNRSYTFWLDKTGNLLLTSALSGKMAIYLFSPTGLIARNRWYHVAGVIDAKSGVMRIFINGMEAASSPFGKDIHVSALPLRIGWTHEEEEQSHSPFVGQIDEVRIWKVARTQEEIQKTMHTALSGKEPGLVGYWRFDGEGNIATDSSPSHADGKLMGDAHFVEAELPTPSELAIPTVISGMITDESGKAIQYASVRLEQDDSEIAQTWTDASGNYWIVIFQPVHGLYDLSATGGDLGDWLFGVRLHEGEHRKLNLTLKKASIIEGTLLMLDDTTPHSAVLVQAVQRDKVIDSTLSDEKGKYRFVNLKPGRYRVRCRIPSEDRYYPSPLQVQRRKIISSVDFRFAPFKKGTWTTFNRLDGLGDNSVNTIHVDKRGYLWVGTRAGVSRFDGKEFVSYTAKNGLASNYVSVIYEDRRGNLWFGTGQWMDGTGEGVSRYQPSEGGGGKFITYTQKEGLIDNAVLAIAEDAQGNLWFGTPKGVSRFDGKEFVNYTTKDGLWNNRVLAIHLDRKGNLWFGTNPGLSRYNGKSFFNYTTGDGLVNDYVLSIGEDLKGNLWFGTAGGVSRFDGKGFVNYTHKDGLVGDIVSCIYLDRHGNLWFGTGTGIAGTGRGVSRFDGVNFVNFTEGDGLAGNSVRAIDEDPNGHIWLGTSGGISRFDEDGFANYSERDGLSGSEKMVRAVHVDRHNQLWFGTDGGGVSRFDGKTFLTYTQQDGLAGNRIWAIGEDQKGRLWFGVTFENAVSRVVYPEERRDGKTFVNYTEQDGLRGWSPVAIHTDRQGNLWFGSVTGVSRYDGKTFVNYTTENGLAKNWVWGIGEDKGGNLWFGTHNGGVSRFDGKKFVTYTTQDGLGDNLVYAIHADRQGFLWFATT